VASDGSERITEVVTALCVVGELPVILTAKLASASADEIPALRDEAEKLAHRVVECCLDTAPADHLRPEEVAELRAEMFQLGETLRAQIGDIVDMCWAQIVGGATSRTWH
jgi:hypothetical protein